MTKALGKNTRNLPVNFLSEEFHLIDKLAFERGISTGELIRRKFRAGLALSHPDLAKQLAGMRRARLKDRALKIAAALTVIGIAGWNSLRGIRHLASTGQVFAAGIAAHVAIQQQSLSAACLSLVLGIVGSGVRLRRRMD